MDRLTPAERIDLKADMERASQLRRMHRPLSGSGLASHALEPHDRQAIESALARYPMLVEMVRRLSEEETQ